MRVLINMVETDGSHDSSRGLKANGFVVVYVDILISRMNGDKRPPFLQ